MVINIGARHGCCVYRMQRLSPLFTPTPISIVASRTRSAQLNAARSRTPRGSNMDPDGLRYTIDRLQLTATETNTFRQRLLFCPSSSAIEATLDSLQSHLRLSPSELRRMTMACPSIIGYNYHSTLQPTLYDLEEHLDLSVTDLKKLVLGLPQILGCSYPANLKPTLDSLQSYLRASDDELRKMLLFQPSILGNNYKDKIQPTLSSVQHYFKGGCGCDPLSIDELRTLIIRQPSIISYSYSDNIQPTLDAIREYLDCSPAELRTLILKSPRLIGFSFEGNTRPKLDILAEELDLSEEELKTFVLNNPFVLSCSLVGLEDKLTWVRDTFIERQVNVNVNVNVQGSRTVEEFDNGGDQRVVPKTPNEQLMMILSQNSFFLDTHLTKTLIPNYELWTTRLSEDTETQHNVPELLRNNTHDLCQSHGRLTQRAQWFDEQDIPIVLLLKKSRYTNAKLTEWMNRWMLMRSKKTITE